MVKQVASETAGKGNYAIFLWEEWKDTVQIISAKFNMELLLSNFHVVTLSNSFVLCNHLKK